MGIRNRKRETLKRLDSKTLDAQFLQEIQHGLNCSPFEAEAVLEVVKEVYFPFLDQQSVKAPPGKVTLIAVDADEPAGKSVVDCEKQNVCLPLHRGPEDDRILQEKGPAGFRQARIPEICREALSQGALLTREDLAYRVFFVSPRTITRDLNLLRQANPAWVIPLRSTVHDIGPVLTHRTKIVLLALEGKTMTQICQSSASPMPGSDRSWRSTNGRPAKSYRDEPRSMIWGPAYPTNGLSVINDRPRAKVPTRSLAKPITVWMRWIATWANLIAYVTAAGRDSAPRRPRIS